MITAGISALLGIIGGAFPDIMKIVANRSESNLEIRRLEIETENAIKLAKVNSDLRVTEETAALDKAEYEGYSQQLQALYKLQSKPSGIKWIDGFNSIIRPATAGLAMLLAFTLIAVQGYVTFEQVAGNIITLQQGVDTLWAGFVGEIIQAALGWMFGYRSARKTASVIR